MSKKQSIPDPTTPDDFWEGEFPRLAALRDNAPCMGSGTFFHGIPNAVSNNPLARDVYRELESDLAALDEQAWRDFTSKLFRCDLRSHGHRGYTGIYSVLYEAKGYRYLEGKLAEWNINYDRITLIPELDGKKTPDWAAVLRGVPVAALEVKTVYASDDQSKYVYDNTRAIREGGEPALRWGNSRIPDALKRKLESTVNYGIQQLKGYAGESTIPRIVFLVIHFDYALADEPTNFATVASFLGNFSDEKIMVAYEFRGLNSPT